MTDRITFLAISGLIVIGVAILLAWFILAWTGHQIPESIFTLLGSIIGCLGGITVPAAKHVSAAIGPNATAVQPMEAEPTEKESSTP